MQCRRAKAYSFSYCLFAYLYKNFDSKFKLPIVIDYVVPTTKLFTQAIAKYVLDISEMIKPQVKPLITKLYPQICSSEERFFDLVKWYDNTVLKNFSLKYKKLNDGNLSILSDDDVIALNFFILCSFIMELVLHSFENKCFFLISSGPTCLAKLLLTFSGTFKDFNTLYVLKHFCEDCTSFTDRITLLNLTLMFKDEVRFMDSNLSSINFVDMSNPSLEIPSLTCGPSSDLQSISTTEPLDYRIKQKNSTERKMKFENSVISSDKRPKTLFKEDVTEFDFVDMSNPSLEIPSLTCGPSSDLQSISNIEPIDYRIKQKNSTERKIKFENSVISSDKRPKTLFKEDVTEFDITSEISASYCSVDEFKPSGISLNSRFTLNLCSYCNEECISYLKEFVDVFKETNYECD